MITDKWKVNVSGTVEDVLECSDPIEVCIINTHKSNNLEGYGWYDENKILIMEIDEGMVGDEDAATVLQRALSRAITISTIMVNALNSSNV